MAQPKAKLYQRLRTKGDGRWMDSRTGTVSSEAVLKDASLQLIRMTI